MSLTFSYYHVHILINILQHIVVYQHFTQHPYLVYLPSQNPLFCPHHCRTLALSQQMGRPLGVFVTCLNNPPSGLHSGWLSPLSWCFHLPPFLNHDSTLMCCTLMCFSLMCIYPCSSAASRGRVRGSNLGRCSHTMITVLIN